MDDLILNPGDARWTVVVRAPEAIDSGMAMIMHERGGSAREAALFALQSAADWANDPTDPDGPVWEAGDFEIVAVFAGHLTAERWQ